ncbi:Vacuolar sorting protein 3 [Camellia lanceoleosa]|uniref:Vacuolar sorting protein 3 n=1 Tax=Camellia lanceoleosa TaxID=1840588 RepID=A0ACC0FLC4_9ERIC|nr:Vacuolar sorting protein 3 [Camellia lanceoleosa]
MLVAEETWPVLFPNVLDLSSTPIDDAICIAIKDEASAAKASHRRWLQQRQPPPVAAADGGSDAAVVFFFALELALMRIRAVESAENSVDFNFFEEGFQVQLALAISVSDPDSREDPETVQIKDAKQISLGKSSEEQIKDLLRKKNFEEAISLVEELQSEGEMTKEMLSFVHAQVMCIDHRLEHDEVHVVDANSECAKIFHGIALSVTAGISILTLMKIYAFEIAAGRKADVLPEVGLFGIFSTRLIP